MFVFSQSRTVTSHTAQAMAAAVNLCMIAIFFTRYLSGSNAGR